MQHPKHYLILLLLFLFSRKGDIHIQKAKLFHSEMAILSICKYDNGFLYAARRMSKNSKWAMYYSEFGEDATSFAKAKRIKIKIKNSKNPRHFVPGDFNPESQELYFTTASNDHLAIAKGHLSGLELTDIGLLSINDKNHNFAHPTLSSDGKSMILSASIDGNMNLYQYHLDAGIWSYQRRILELESGYDEILPHLINDSTLVFSSNRDGGKGSFDLYLTKAERPDFWGEPINLSELNSQYDEFSYLPIDSTSGYFTSADTIFGSTGVYYFDRKK